MRGFKGYRVGDSERSEMGSAANQGNVSKTAPQRRSKDGFEQIEIVR